MRTDDPLRDFDRWDADHAAWLEKRPVCEKCGEHIQQDYAVCIDDHWYCDACLDESRVWVGDD